MKIIGRQKEIQDLEKYIESKQSVFIALYGRIRVGKTFLIRNLLGNKFAFAATGILEGNASEQKKIFSSDGKMKKEFHRLYGSLFKNPEST